MSDVSKIKIGSTSYDVADKTAREDISDLNDYVDAVVEMEQSDYSTLNNALSKKYDSSNIVTGSGTLTNVSTSNVSVRYANYTYQRVGKFVTLNIKMQLNASTGNLLFKGLPVSLNANSTSSHGVCVSDQNVIGLWLICYDSYRNITMLQIGKSDNSQWAHNSGESISFMATYEI